MSSLFLWRFLHIVCGLGLFFAWTKVAKAQASTGVAIVKARPQQNDEFARPVMFQRFQRFGVVSNFYVGADQPIVVQNNCIAAVVTFDTWLTQDLTEQAHLLQLAEKRKQLLEICKKHPAAAAPLQTILADFGSLIQQMQSGMVRFRGGWMSSTQHRKLVADEQAAEEKRLKQRAEAAAAEKAKKEAEMAAEKAKAEKIRADREAAQLAKEAAKRAKQEDIAERERNAKSRPQHMAAMLQLQALETFNRWLKVKLESESRGSELPNMRRSSATTLKMPKIEDLEVQLSHAKRYDSYALLTWAKDGQEVGLRMTLPLRGEEGDLINEQELREMHADLKEALPQIADWLPVAVASARTQMALQQHRTRYKRPALVSREISGMKCELHLSLPELHDDGSTYQLLQLSIF